MSKSTSKRCQPSRARRNAVREAFDPDALIRICTADSDDFAAYGERVELEPWKDGRERFYYHRDNGSGILAVAHLDTVQSDVGCAVTDTAAGLLVASPALDDRLGAYVILELLPKLGITVDWLLTTDEEMGASTADEFNSDKAYDWMFSFDRGGTDVVAYQYETPELVERIEKAGARVGIGSFSCISVLDRLGCAGVNWGVGYRDYHSLRAHAWLEDTFRMVARFGRFYRANLGTYLPYDPEYQSALDAKVDDWWTYHCEDCGGVTVKSGAGLNKFCEHCFERAVS